MATHATRARLTTYASLAAATAAAAVGGTADASTVVSTALNGTVIGWNTGASQTPTTTVTNFGGLGVNNGFKIATRATANGGSSASSFFGVVIAWQGAGSGQFRRGGPGTNPAFLAAYGSNQAAGFSASAFANVNLATSNGFNSGNAAFAGASPQTSKYLLFNFQASGSTYYGWIEILATTTGVTGTGPFTSGYSATLGRWAYDTSGTAITAGQIITSAVPGGAGLAALAFGAAGLRGRRRSRN